MSPPESPLQDPLEGELAEPPPSDLSDYTWEDSETQHYEPGRDEANRATPVRVGSPSPATGKDDAVRFVDVLTQNRLVGDSDIKALWTQIFPSGGPGNVDRLAAELIRLGKLTKYQAAAIRQGKTKGLVIGNYVVLDKIGSGGMGLVLKARHRQLQRTVALKLLPPSISRDRAAVIRFRREVAAVANLRHPNIVAALDAGETGGLLFLVMELVDGKDLARIVREKGPLPVSQAVDCIIQAARGLMEAHSRGIVHRDIKPANLLLDRSGTVKVLDLGLARVSQGQDLLTSESSELNLTVSGSFVGTVDYMSPEQAYDPRLADCRSDIYSLGCTLHYLLTAKPPFGGQTFMERLLAHRERPIPALSRTRDDIPTPVNDAFRKLLAKSPEARPQSMANVVDLLQASRTASASTGSRPSRLVGSPLDATDEEPASIYDMAEPTPMAVTSRPELVSNVFVRSRGSSSDRVEGPSFTRRRRRRKLLSRLLLFAIGIGYAWYLAVHYGWIRRR
jgi:serine/threonine protein kinase